MEKKEAQPLSYDSAWTELQQIVSELQAETVGIDALAEKIERATLLSDFCKQRLRMVEEKLIELNANNT